MLRATSPTKGPLWASLVVVSVLAAGCSTAPDGPGDGAATALDPDGEWWIDVQITSCYSATGGGSVSVVDGVFGKTLLYTYTVDGQQQSVSVDGEFSPTGNSGALRIEGNMWVEGDACDGGNGYSGFVEGDPLTGQASSSWGTATFTKQ